MNQKELAGLLDRAAARAELVDKAPATSKQCWFLAGLIIKASDDKFIQEVATNTSYALTKNRASTLIEEYLKDGQ